MKQSVKQSVKQSLWMGCAFALFPTVACFNVGTQAESFKVASQPNGAMAYIASSVGDISGELLAVQDDGIVILHNSALELVPYSSIRWLRLDQLDDDYSLTGNVPVGARRARLAAVSRYPQGIDATLRQRLLARLHQSELHVLQ